MGDDEGRVSERWRVVGALLLAGVEQSCAKGVGGRARAGAGTKQEDVAHLQRLGRTQK